MINENLKNSDTTLTKLTEEYEYSLNNNEYDLTDNVYDYISTLNDFDKKVIFLYAEYKSLRKVAEETNFSVMKIKTIIDKMKAFFNKNITK